MIIGVTTLLSHLRACHFTIALRFPFFYQKRQFSQITQYLKNTDYYRTHAPEDTSYDAFAKAFPIVSYELIQPFIDQTIAGKEGCLVPGTITQFAKSSGTTSAQSKYIPITKKSLIRNHFRAGADLFAWTVSRYNLGQIIAGKTLSITGSFSTIPNTIAQSGDISAFLSSRVTAWAKKRQFPEQDIALLPNWQEKKDTIVAQAAQNDVRAIFGTPTWTLRILESITATGTPIHTIWPNLTLFVHGAVGFEPYKKPFLTLTKGLSIQLVEAYNATEGFFAFGDEKGLLLLTHHGVFYEFVEKQYWANPQGHAIPLQQVRLATDYALIITTYNGLIRYMVGDAIRFTSLAPYRMVIIGRTKQHINAFGEEVMGTQIEQAVSAAAERTGATIHAFTVGPVHNNDGTGRHQWLIAFEDGTAPATLDTFSTIIDTTLQQLNSDYEAKRAGILQAPLITIATPTQFLNYLAKQKKLGGQYKIPVATNDLTLINNIVTEKTL